MAKCDCMDMSALNNAQETNNIFYSVKCFILNRPTCCVNVHNCAKCEYVCSCNRRRTKEDLCN